MALPINSISSISSSIGVSSVRPPSTPAGSGGFASMLEGAIQSVEQPGRQASEATLNFLNGDGEELHNVALSVQKASIAFDLGLQVRNKVVSAYQEIMRMQM